MKTVLLSIFLFCYFFSFPQMKTSLTQQQWVDSVFSSLSEDQRIGQLMVVRLSSRNEKGVVWYDQEVTDNIQKYNIGSICLFQGNPVKQAEMINKFQSLAKTPLMICIDGEWGIAETSPDNVIKMLLNAFG